MRKLLASTVAFCILATATPAFAEPRARLEVDTSELGGVGPVLKDRLVERGSQVLRDESVTLGGPKDPIVRVTVTEIAGDDPGFQYEVRLVTKAGEDGASWSEGCELCTEAELIDKVAAELEKVAVSLHALDDQQQDEAAEPPPPAPIVDDPVPTEPPERDRSLNTKGKAGIGMLAVGVLAAGTGVGLVLAPARPLADDPLRETYTQPPGYAVLAVGGAALVTGAVLLGLGLRDRKRAMARHRSGYFAVRWGSPLATTPTQVARPQPPAR